MSNLLSFLNDKKTGIIIMICGIMLLVFSSLVEKLSGPSFDEIYIKVEEKDLKLRYTVADSLRPVIKTYNANVQITGHPYFKMKKENHVLGLFIPDFAMYDIIYGFLILSVCVIFLKRMWKFDPDKPFSSQIVEGVKYAAIACFIFTGIDYFRFVLINNYILDATNNFYHLKKFHFHTTPLAWSGVLLIWLYRIIQKACALQTEQEFTV
ncbi:MAG: hypothetical protein H7Y01_02480 [Ferruginibacter sp.]|nr:hypothetical protein [Chitinophagaceae bacterium]